MSDDDETARAVRLGPVYLEALDFAMQVHGGQVRTGTSVPYFAHVLGVSAIVLEYGGREREAIAALLHDAVEDSEQPDETAKLVKRVFGKRVRDLVLMCSDTTLRPKPPWLDRKRQYLAHVRFEATQGEQTGFLRVSLADKLHNVGAILAGRDAIGDAVFDRFSAGKEHTVAYYAGLRDAFSLYRGDDGGIHRLVHRFAAEVGRLGLVERAALDDLCA